MVRKVLFAIASTLLLACNESVPTEPSYTEHLIALSGDLIFSGPDPSTQQQFIYLPTIKIQAMEWVMGPFMWGTQNSSFLT